MPRVEIPVEFLIPPEPHDRYFVMLDMPFDKETNEELKKAIPGMTWGPGIGSQKHWHVPGEMQNYAAEVLFSRGYERPQSIGRCSGPYYQPERVSELHPWQLDGHRFLKQNGYGYIMFAPGLGKTAPTLIAAKDLAGKGRILWVCPAMVRWTIAREAEKWIPGVKVAVLSPGKISVPSDANLVVVSYNQIEHVMSYPFDVLVFDEAHNIKNKKSDRSVLAREICLANPKAARVMLSGTPVPNRPHDLWHPLDLMCPKRFGTEWQFQQRYSVIGHNGYGRTIGGLNPQTADELFYRLNAVGVRATEEDAAGRLPPLNIEIEWYEQDEELAGLDEEKFLASAKEVKAKWALALAKEERDLGRKIAIVTWHREVAEIIAKGLGVRAITGEIPSTTRDTLLTDIAKDPTAPLVATMASIAEGLNQLVAFQNVILAETYYRPASVVQVLKRFHRLTSKGAVMVRTLCIPGTADENIVSSLISKTEDINRVLRAGAVEQGVAGLVEKSDLGGMLDSWLGEEG